MITATRTTTHKLGNGDVVAKEFRELQGITVTGAITLKLGLWQRRGEGRERVMAGELQLRQRQPGALAFDRDVRSSRPERHDDTTRSAARAPAARSPRRYGRPMRPVPRPTPPATGQAGRSGRMKRPGTARAVSAWSP